MTITPCFVGCDISLKTLDICLLTGDIQRHFNQPNTAAGHVKLAALLAKTPISLFVLEASGGYEAALFYALQHAKIPVVRLQAPQTGDHCCYAQNGRNLKRNGASAESIRGKPR